MNTQQIPNPGVGLTLDLSEPELSRCLYARLTRYRKLWVANAVCSEDDLLWAADNVREDDCNGHRGMHEPSPKASQIDDGNDYVIKL